MALPAVPPTPATIIRIEEGRLGEANSSGRREKPRKSILVSEAQASCETDH